MPINNLKDAALRVIYLGREDGAGSSLNTSMGPLLEICLAQTHSDGAYVHRLDREPGLLELTVWRGMRPTDIRSYQVQLDGEAAHWFLTFAASTVLETSAWQDRRLQKLPEFVHNRFQSVLSVPIVDAGNVVGLVNFCRRSPGRYAPQEIGFLGSLGTTLGTVLAGAAALHEKDKLQFELEALNRKLADRKLLERAKGILQSRFAWSEEEAYFRLRRTSRQSRKPMSTIAAYVIQNSTLPAPWGEAAYIE
jgi:GAF domain-containing protein